jgi:DNA-binding transcriptional ArsR family regulator
MQALACLSSEHVENSRMDNPDLLFKALADPSRRKLLDVLHANDGQTLTELCAHLAMTRQAATQHLGVLEAAGLLAIQRRGREKLHFLNRVPLQSIYQRWLRKFDEPRLQALHDLKQRLEGDPDE